MLNFPLHPLLTMGIAALVPMILGFIWYNPNVFGKAWLEACGLTPEKAREGFKPALVFPLSFVLSFLLAASLNSVVIHQFGFFSMMADPEGQKQLADHTSSMYIHARAIFDMCSGSFRTFRHGAFHGTLLGLLTIVPILATNAMFERRSFKYFAINAGYWIVNLAIMGALICHFMPHTGIFPIKGF